MEKLIIFPCNGTAVEALDCAKYFEVIGFVDDLQEKQGKVFGGVKVFSRALFEEFPDAKVLAVPGGPSTYKEKAINIQSLNLSKERFATVIHPQASISAKATIGSNVLIMAGVVLTANARVGDNVCILPNTVIHHDCLVSDYCFIGANVTIAGSVEVGKNCFVGSGSTIINNCSIGEYTLIGLGTTVIKSVGSHTKVVGNPGKEI